MIYEQLFSRTDAIVSVALIGCGDFGKTIVTQGSCVSRMKIQVAADLVASRVVDAYESAGVPKEKIVPCKNAAEARLQMEAGNFVALEDPMIIMELPVDVVICCTRSPESGARYALAAIEAGKHVVMVDKEADSVVGPMLKVKADRMGVVYTTDDGDEPGLLMGLVGWARSLGMEVLAGGKTNGFEYDSATGTVTNDGHPFEVEESLRWCMESMTGDRAMEDVLDTRALVFKRFETRMECGDPICHLAVATNGTGLLPDAPTGRRPYVRIRELASVMAPREMGGIYGTRHVVDIPSVIGSINEPPYGGNVFVIVHCDNEHAMQMIKRKGVMVNSAGTTAALLRPYHLCGAETAMSVLCAGILGIPTGAARPLPYVDITCTTRRRFKAGEEIGPLLDSGWNQDLRAALVQGVRVRPGNPLPFFMLEGNRCKCDIPEGTLITCEMIELRPDSILWALRKEQDEYFAHMLAE